MTIIDLINEIRETYKDGLENSKIMKEYYVKSEDDFICPKCGAVIRKKEESILKGNDDPLVCPKCQSLRLDYHMSYIT